MRTKSFTKFKSQVLTLVLTIAALAVGQSAWAGNWDTHPDENGKYDEFYDRPTYFPDFEQPASWPNAEYYVVRACLGKNGPRIENYEVAVYDQNNQLRHCNRSMAKDDHLCVLTIRGTEGDEFHCQIIYGDFVNPTIVDVEETFGFKTNALVGSNESPFILTAQGRTYLSELSDNLPEDETNANVTVMRTIQGGKWNTICLPFAMTNSQMKTAFGDDVLLGDFVGYEYTENEKKEVVSIKVKFVAADAIEPNHPYIIKVREDMTEFSVDNVDIDASDAPMVATCEHNKRQWSEFIGTYVQNTTVPEECLFISDGKFYYSVGKTKMKGYRAYFSFYDVLEDYESTSEAPVYIDYPEDPAAIVSVDDERGVMVATWYTLDGRKLSVKPTTKGLYIYNGKKIAIK
jgi:hypothetical protein